MIMPYAVLPTGIMQSLRKIVKTGGEYVTDGSYQKPTENRLVFQGAILPLSKSDMKFDVNGTYSEDTQKLYTYTKFINGQELFDRDNNRWQVQNEADYNPYGGNIKVYYVKRISATAK
jgi:hypothetical protein